MKPQTLMCSFSRIFGEGWSKTFGGADYDEAYSVQQTSYGGYILAESMVSYGDGYDGFWLIKVGGTGITSSDIEKPPEKFIPGFGAFGAMFTAFVLFLSMRRRV